MVMHYLLTIPAVNITFHKTLYALQRSVNIYTIIFK